MYPSHAVSRPLILTLSLTLGAPGLADTAPNDPETLMSGIDAMRRLPAGGVRMVQSGSQVFFLSDNGRYAFFGPGFDLWHGVRLTSLPETERLMGRLDRTRLTLDAGDLGALDVGTGTAEVLVFADPRCGACAALLERLQALPPPLLKQYRFRLIPVPVLGGESQREVLALSCLAERDRTAALEAWLAQRTAELPPPTDRCGQGPLQRALVTAHLLGLERVPFLIAPDGRLQSGAPPDLEAWLAGGEGV